MSTQVRRDMFRKCDQAIGNIEQAQEHILWIVDLFSKDKEITELIEMQQQDKLNKETHPYADQLNLTLQTITMLELVKEGIANVKEILRNL